MEYIIYWVLIGFVLGVITSYFDGERGLTVREMLGSFFIGGVCGVIMIPICFFVLNDQYELVDFKKILDKKIL